MPLIPPETFFRELTFDWMEAWKTRNPDRLHELVGEDFCFISRRFKTFYLDKQEWLRMALEQYELKSYEIGFVTVRRREHTAVVVYTFDVMASPNHTNSPEHFLVTDIWSRQVLPDGGNDDDGKDTEEGKRRTEPGPSEGSGKIHANGWTAISRQPLPL